jgi:geranylgeranyl reductase family protein
MTDTMHDVIVIGAGPSGALCAHTLRRLGLSVLVLDKTAFPRSKPCGGGLTIKALALMPYSVAPVLERMTRGFALGFRTPAGDSFRTALGRDPVCTFAVRDRFDAFNFEQMLAVGADFETLGRIEAITEAHDGVTVETEGRTFRARYLVGADGANSRVRRLLRLDAHIRRGFALEGIVPYAALETEPRPEFLFGATRNGYGWLFPKGDHVNVGLYTIDDDPSLSKGALKAYAGERLGTDAIEGVVGMPLGFGGERRIPVRDRVVLVGDAAGYAEPLLGEGIHNALKSGIAAAQAIFTASTGGGRLQEAYRRQIAPVMDDLTRCRQMADLFYPDVNLGKALLALGKPALLRGFAAGKTMVELTNLWMFSAFFRPMTPVSLAEMEQPGSRGSTSSP